MDAKANDKIKLENQISRYKNFAWTLVWFGVAAAAFGFWRLYCDAGKDSLTNLSSIGSYFQGAVGSLWALAGLMFIYVAFLGQRLQLAKQDEELETQQRNFALQQFENGFFQLLNLHHDIAREMHQIITSHIGFYSSGDISPKHEHGRHLFENWYNELKAKLDSVDNLSRLQAMLVSQNNSHKKKLEIKREFVKDIYKTQFYKNHQGELGHYFRNLYHLFKYVNNCDVLKDTSDIFKDKDNEQTTKNKRRYTSMARAQLSQYELALLFYNGISDYGCEDFKPLIEKYGLLENFNTEDLPDQEHQEFYETAAF
jgi:hypothetical protein